MSPCLLAEFRQPDAVVSAIQSARQAGCSARDAFAPFEIEEIATLIAADRNSIRSVMLICGLCTALCAYGLQVYSAVFAYPFDSGGRPLHSWPVFLLVPFEVSVLVAAIGGLIAFFRECRLPRLHDPLFAIPGFERASQDRFFLLVEADGSDEGEVRLRHLMDEAGALTVSRVLLA